jgi:hypothetical protein
MFDWPMSSTKITTMFGFFAGACAAAGEPVRINANMPTTTPTLVPDSASNAP